MDGILHHGRTPRGVVALPWPDGRRLIDQREGRLAECSANPKGPGIGSVWGAGGWLGSLGGLLRAGDRKKSDGLGHLGALQAHVRLQAQAG